MRLLKDKKQLRKMVTAGLFFCLLILLITGCALKEAMNGIFKPGPQSQTQTAAPVQTTAAPTATEPACIHTDGLVNRVHFHSDTLNAELYASIYTPPCYDPENSGGYPMLMLLHGQGQDDHYWVDLGITDLADRAIQSGRKPFLIVLPYEEKNYDPVTESQFGSAVMDELVPWVETHYAISPLRQDRAIGGISRGGGWAIHLALSDLDAFGSLGAHSPGVFGFDWVKAGRLRDSLGADAFPRIAIDRGDGDYLYEATDKFADALEKDGIEFDYILQPGVHNGSYWKSHTEDYLDWYMQGWDPQ